MAKKLVGKVKLQMPGRKGWANRPRRPPPSASTA